MILILIKLALKRQIKRFLKMILTITDQEFQEMRMAVMDDDKDGALRMIKAFIKRLEKQSQKGMKSHLDG
jgi:hypothetical protein